MPFLRPTLHGKIVALAGPAPDELDKPARPPDPGNGERTGRHAGHGPAGRGRSRLAEIGSFGRPAPAADGDADGAGAFGRQLQTTRGRHRKPGRFGNDTAEAAMTKPLFEAAQERSLVASLDVDDPVGVETGHDRKSDEEGKSEAVRV